MFWCIGGLSYDQLPWPEATTIYIQEVTKRLFVVYICKKSPTTTKDIHLFICFIILAETVEDMVVVVHCHSKATNPIYFYRQRLQQFAVAKGN